MVRCRTEAAVPLLIDDPRLDLQAVDRPDAAREFDVESGQAFLVSPAHCALGKGPFRFQRHAGARLLR
jgi:hypothetical protein